MNTSKQKATSRNVCICPEVLQCEVECELLLWGQGVGGLVLVFRGTPGTVIHAILVDQCHRVSCTGKLPKVQ